MAGPLLKTCCLCQSLRNGSIISGVLGIILAIATIIFIFVTKEVAFSTILFNWIPPAIVKIILVINLCMTIFISILLIVGVMKRNHYLMLPWVVLGIMLAVGLLISIIYTSVEAFLMPRVVFGVLMLVFGLIFVVVYVYMWAVVYSHFANLQEESNRGRYNKQPYRR